MTLIQVVPDAPYFVWQLYVQMQNFREWGIEGDAVVLVAANSPSREMKEFEAWAKCKVFYYEDTRQHKVYTSSIRPHLLAKHFKEYPIDVFLYHDQDIIFIEKPLIEQSPSDKTCYVAAAANSYTSAKYLKAFKKYQFPSMCEIVGIDPEVVERNDINCGGAQYIIKGVDYKFWEKVENDCEALYTYMVDITKTGLRKYKPEEVLPDYHVQVWCADMWAVFWNLLLLNKEVRQNHNIDFSWPWEMKNSAKPIMHNAGIDGSNEDKVLWYAIDKEGNIASSQTEPCEKHYAQARANEVGGTIKEASRKKEYFNKSRYNGATAPFNDDVSFVSKDRVQEHYVKLFSNFKNNTMTQPKRRFKVLGIFCTTNNIHPDLLKLSLQRIRIAQLCAQDCDVEIVTVAWKELKEDAEAFHNFQTPYNGLGHLNYLLQLKQGLFNDPQHSDVICILEHDVIYPENYFDEIVNNWSASHYGVCNNNYIGVNETGYCDVVERHQPMSLMSFAKAFFEMLLDQKVNEVVKSIGSDLQKTHYPYGWTCVEPDDKNLMKFIDFSDVKPVIHVNMNHSAHRHHFTGHADVCYEQDAKGKTYREDWGDYSQYFTFNQ